MSSFAAPRLLLALLFLAAALPARGQAGLDCGALPPSEVVPDSDGDGIVDPCDVCPTDPLNLCGASGNASAVVAAEPSSVYKKIAVVGTSPTSFEEATRVAIEEAGKIVRNMSRAEVAEQSLTVKDGKIAEYQVELLVYYRISH